MKLIVGLGNPGEKYKNNRHNVGHMAIDRLLKLKLPAGTSVRKSDVFMNDSGSYVARTLSKYPDLPLSCLYIIHDDLDIKLGEFKIQYGHGPKDHNGLKSVDLALGTGDYWHVRIGVDNRNAGSPREGEGYVLADFTDDEKKILENVIKEVCKRLVTS